MQSGHIAREPREPREQSAGARDAGAARGRRIRRVTAVAGAAAALIASSFIAGPAGADAPRPCALERTDAHHSEGVDTWNAAYPQPRRELRAVMVFLSFPDSRPRTTPADLAADHFPATSDFFARSSYGRFQLRAEPLKRWIEMPADSTSYEIQRDWEPDRRARYLRDAVDAVDPKVDFGDYDIVYFVADPDAPGVDSDATKVVNFDRPLVADGTRLRRIVTVFEQHPPDRNVLAHETGHVFDLPDLYHRPADGKADWDTHVGDWDMMGSQFGLAPDPFAWHKWRLGWITDAQVGCVNKTGTSTWSVQPLHAPPLRGALRSTRLVVIRTGSDSALAVEVRARGGNDAESCTEGVLVYRVRARTASGEGPIEVVDAHPGSSACQSTSVYPPLADAPLGAGERLDLPEDGVTVSVTGRAPDGGWTLRVDRR
ncbi:M6 family metalloprotease domain-containing protein [Streptomyces polyrhachis]|uniref:M6 family metalloprotease domain-containing protein n=1 Tax=Streptomyces polyrhachis TaxID=1282885 RepID=A0ABW2GCB9_9ACTN